MNDTTVIAASDGHTAAVEPVDVSIDPVVVRSGLAGVLAEYSEQRRASKEAAIERRLRLAEARATGQLTTWIGRSLESARALPGRLLAGGVGLGWLMALVGSAVGQLTWWATQFPLWLAAAFALAFEAIMIGAGRRARDRRMKHRPAGALRLVAWSAAAVAAALNWVHLSNPRTHVSVFDEDLAGSPALGAAFALFTAAGFLVHELAENAAVNDALRDAGIIQPLGKRWLFVAHAIRARLKLIDQPALTVDEAWELTRRSRKAQEQVVAEAAVTDTAGQDGQEPVIVERGNVVTAQGDESDQPAAAMPADTAGAADTPAVRQVLPARTEQASRAEKVNVLVRHLRDGQDLTGGQAAQLVGKSDRTARRYLREARSRVMAGRTWPVAASDSLTG